MHLEQHWFVTLLYTDCTVDAMAVLKWREAAFYKLKSLRHESWSLQLLLQKCDDALEECETMGQLWLMKER
jgi:hypothetical protein